MRRDAGDFRLRRMPFRPEAHGRVARRAVRVFRQGIETGRCSFGGSSVGRAPGSAWESRVRIPPNRPSVATDTTLRTSAE